MKKFKVSILAIFAVVVAAIFSSFTLHKKTTEMWFEYNSGSLTSASSYTPAGGTGAEPGCSSNVATVCAIYATDSGGNPLQADLDDIATRSSNFHSLLPGELKYKTP